VKLRSISWLIDQALEQIENLKIDGKLLNPKLKGVLTCVSQYQVENHNLDVVCGKTPSKKKPEYFGGDLPFIKIPDVHNNAYVVSPSERLSESGMASQSKKRSLLVRFV